MAISAALIIPSTGAGIASAAPSAAASTSKPPATGDAALVEELEAAGDGRVTIEEQPSTGRAALVGMPADLPLDLGAQSPEDAAFEFARRYGAVRC